MDDFAPVSEIGILPYILLVNNDLPVENAPELVDYLMEHPGEVNHGATGTGPTFVQELFKYRTGTEFENLMYEGTAPAIQALMHGYIQLDRKSVGKGKSVPVRLNSGGPR